MNSLKYWILLIVCLSSFTGGWTQQIDTTTINKKRLKIVLVSTGVAYTAGMVALSQAWYKNQSGDGGFNFFNDNAQWNYIDKFGHMYSAYQISRTGSEMFQWTNMSHRKSAIWGSVLSQALLIPIEIMDGFSEDYGFSWGDILANMTGAGLFLSQELIWQKQFVKMKFSFHTTPYAPLRPEVLGNGIPEEILKDYNGQTYWFSFDIYNILPKDNKFPKWINIALGYGADGMVYGRESDNQEHGYESYRQYYFSIDWDLSHIHTNKKGIKILLFIADMIKLPAPALEFNAKQGINFHFIYF